MILGNQQHQLQINNYFAFLHISNLNNIIYYKAEIDKNISEDKLKALIILCKNGFSDSNLKVKQKLELFKWADTLPIVTIAIADDRCFGELMELFLICDMRLGGIDLHLEFPEDESEFIYSLEERCQLVMGKERGREEYRRLFMSSLSKTELLDLRLINKYIDMSDFDNEIENYLDKIIGTKDLYHIKAIKKCFNNYKRLGLNASQELLLEEESRQCAILIVDEYLRSRAKS